MLLMWAVRFSISSRSAESVDMRTPLFGAAVGQDIGLDILS
jgi:hypothetical protein